MEATLTDYAVYGGKLQYNTYAINENFIMAFPMGLLEGAPAWIFSTWTKSADGISKEPFDDIKSSVTFTGRLSFHVKGPSYYYFDCVFKNGAQDVLEVKMRNPKAEVVTTMGLTRL